MSIDFHETCYIPVSSGLKLQELLALFLLILSLHYQLGFVWELLKMLGRGIIQSLFKLEMSPFLIRLNNTMSIHLIIENANS